MFEGFFEGSKKLEISAQNEDIRLFLDTQIQQQYRLSRHARADPSLKMDIVETITGECHGM